MEKKKYEITEKDRSKFVRDDDYGEIQTCEIENLDKPVYAKLEYNEGGIIIDADFTELEKVLDELLREEHKIKKQKTDEVKISIQYNKLKQLKLSEIELQHAIDYYQEKGIIVRGISSNPDGEFDNYEYYRTYRNINKFPERIPNYDVEAKIALYQQNHDMNLKKEIVEQTMRLVPYVAFKYKETSGIDIEELNSYGYEGLITAIDKFDVTQNKKFTTYAVIYIRCYIISGIKQMKLERSTTQIAHMYENYYKYVKIYCNLKGYTKYNADDPEIMNDVLNIMLSDHYSIEYIEELKGFLKFKNAESLEKLCESDIEQDDLDELDIEDSSSESLIFDLNSENDLEKVEDSVVHEQLKKELYEMLKDFTDKEREVIKHRFGLDNLEPKTLTEIGKMFQVTSARIRQIESKVISKLSYPMYRKRLKGYYKTLC